MARYLRSTNLPFALLTCARLCISSPIPQFDAGAVHAVPDHTPAIIRSASAGQLRRLFPIVIEIEPVIRRNATIVLETLHIRGHHCVEEGVSLRALEMPCIGQPLEMDVVAVAAEIQTEHENNRALQ